LDNGLGFLSRISGFSGIKVPAVQFLPSQFLPSQEGRTKRFGVGFIGLVFYWVWIVGFFGKDWIKFGLFRIWMLRFSTGSGYRGFSGFGGFYSKDWFISFFVIQRCIAESCHLYLFGVYASFVDKWRKNEDEVPHGLP
jgi:hypothetical protein